MRHLASCLSAFLCTVSAPALAANDGHALLGLRALPALASTPAPAPMRGRYGGGFVEAPLTGGLAQEPQMAAPTAGEPAPDVEAGPAPQFQRREVDYTGPEAPGTIVVDTPDKFLFLIEPWESATLWRRRGPSRVRMGRSQADQPQVRMAGVDAAVGNAAAPARFTALHGWRAR